MVIQLNDLFTLEVKFRKKIVAADGKFFSRLSSRNFIFPSDPSKQLEACFGLLLWLFRDGFRNQRGESGTEKIDKKFYKHFTV